MCPISIFMKIMNACFKFETIGGGVYMLVSGVPVKIDEHAREMSLMSLHMLEKIQTVINPFSNKPLELQIGTINLYELHLS